MRMRRPIFLQSHITDESSGILGLHFWMISDRKTLQLFSGCMGVHIDQTLNILTRYDPHGSTDNIKPSICGNIQEMVKDARAVNTRLLFSPTWPGNKVNVLPEKKKKQMQMTTSTWIYGIPCRGPHKGKCTYCLILDVRVSLELYAVGVHE